MTYSVDPQKIESVMDRLRNKHDIPARANFAADLAQAHVNDPRITVGDYTYFDRHISLKIFTPDNRITIGI